MSMSKQTAAAAAAAVGYFSASVVKFLRPVELHNDGANALLKI